MSYAQIGQGDPLRSGPEREKMTQMDIAKLPSDPDHSAGARHQHQRSGGR